MGKRFDRDERNKMRSVIKEMTINGQPDAEIAERLNALGFKKTNGGSFCDKDIHNYKAKWPGLGASRKVTSARKRVRDIETDNSEVLSLLDLVFSTNISVEKKSKIVMTLME